MFISTAVAFAMPLLDVKYGPWVTAVSETEATIVWTTESNSFDWIEMVEDNGQPFYSAEATRYYQTVSGRRTNGTTHRVRITGLKPGHTYMYRVQGQQVLDDSDPYSTSYGPVSQTKICKVKTMDNKSGSCRFAMVNDIHFDDERFTALCNPVGPDNYDFLLLNGDIVSYASSADSVLKHTFGPIAQQTASMPVFFARGNHEGRGAEWSKLPEFFPSSSGEFYYTFRQGPVAFVVLDAGEDKPDSCWEYSNTAQYDEYRAIQAEWLKNVVKDPIFAKAPIKVAIIHIPAICEKGSWYGQREISRIFNPILKNAGVDLMLSGHHHCYMYFKPGQADNPFPILVNSNMERMDFIADSKHIEINTFDINGEKVNHFELKK